MQGTDEFLGSLILERGAHKRGQGMDVMEAAAHLAGEPLSDHPQCVSPVIAAFLRRSNDRMETERRNRVLKPLIPLVLHTRGTEEQERVRMYLCADWAVREAAPMVLDREYPGHAARLRALPPIVDAPSAKTAAAAAFTVRSAAHVVAHAADHIAVSAAAFAAAFAADSSDDPFAADDVATFAADAAEAVFAATGASDDLITALVHRLIAVTSTTSKGA